MQGSGAWAVSCRPSGPFKGSEQGHDMVRFTVYKGDSGMGDVSTGRREVGAWWELLAIQTEVMRAVAMTMEKRAHPKSSQDSPSQEAQGSLERALNLESAPAVSSV